MSYFDQTSNSSIRQTGILARIIASWSLPKNIRFKRTSSWTSGWTQQHLFQFEISWGKFIKEVYKEHPRCLKLPWIMASPSLKRFIKISFIFPQILLEPSPFLDSTSANVFWDDNALWRNPSAYKSLITSKDLSLTYDRPPSPIASQLF